MGNEVVPSVAVTDFPVLEAILSAFHREYVANCVGVIKQGVEALSPFTDPAHIVCNILLIDPSK
jgi:hypothetical protein